MSSNLAAALSIEIQDNPQTEDSSCVADAFESAIALTDELALRLHESKEINLKLFVLMRKKREKRGQRVN
jgi:hypothetical protein